MALTSLLDSEATFAQKATDGGLSEPYIDALKRNSVATFAKLSFAITKSGETAAETQVNTFLTTVRPGVNPTIADLAAFKRLLFESQTIMIQNARSAVKGDEQGPQRMPQPEREARLTRMKRELRSIDISGPLEPAHSLYDMCFETIERTRSPTSIPTDAYPDSRNSVAPSQKRNCNSMHQRLGLWSKRSNRIRS